ncbi:MAG: CbiX/SirB N-terminal domain-containing protein [bacterium]|jgi:sirohydrochlorin cobaltochelatase
MNALILFSHGSLLCGSGEAVEAHAARLRDRREFDFVGVGFLNYSQPSFAETVHEAVALGATRILILPYFLIPGFFVSKSLPEVLTPIQAQFPNVDFQVAEALGFDTRLADALWESALSARTADNDQWSEPLKRATLSCRPSPDCPLYQTPLCPKVPGEKKLHD